MQSSLIWLLSPFITLNSYSCVHVCTCTCFYVCMCEEAWSKPWMLYFRYDLLHFETGFLTGAQGSWIWLKCVAKRPWNPRLPIPASAPALGLSACNTAPIFFCGCWGWNLGSREVLLLAWQTLFWLHHLPFCYCVSLSPGSEGSRRGSCLLMRVSLQPNIFLHIILGQIYLVLITTSEERYLRFTTVERGGWVPGPECQCQEAGRLHDCLSKELTMGSRLLIATAREVIRVYSVIRTGIRISTFSVPRHSFSYLYPGKREQSPLPRDTYENSNEPIVVWVSSVETQPWNWSLPMPCA